MIYKKYNRLDNFQALPDRITTWRACKGMTKEININNMDDLNTFLKDNM